MKRKSLGSKRTEKEKETKEIKRTKQPKEVKAPKTSKQSKEAKALKTPKLPREPKKLKQPRQPKELIGEQKKKQKPSPKQRLNSLQKQKQSSNSWKKKSPQRKQLQLIANRSKSQTMLPKRQKPLKNRSLLMQSKRYIRNSVLIATNRSPFGNSEEKKRKAIGYVQTYISQTPNAIDQMYLNRYLGAELWEK